MRTQDEIVARVRAARNEFFSFEDEALVPYLDFEHAREFLKPETTAEEWERLRHAADREKALAEMRDYMEFAWGKVEDHRGLSAGRSVEKMTAWVWLLGDDATLAKVEEAGYAQYGAPKLAVICEAYGFQIPTSPEVQRMIRGERCGAGYDCGCG